MSRPCALEAILWLTLAGVAPAAACDTAPPALVSLAPDRTTIDVSGDSQTITFTLRVTDAASEGCGGVDYVAIYTVGPNRIHNAYTSVMTLVSGDELDGVRSARITIPRFSEPGAWAISQLVIKDKVGNWTKLNQADLVAAGLPGGFTVVNPTPDYTGPQVASLAFSPTTVDVSAAAQRIDFSLRVTDDLSGGAYVAIYLASPSRSHSAWTSIRATPQVDANRSLSITIPTLVEGGTWFVHEVYMTDAVGNVRRYSTSDLIAASFPTTFTVVSPTSDVTDPQLLQLSLPTTRIDCSLDEQQVSVTLRASDDLSGLSGIGVYFASPTRATQVYTSAFAPPLRTSGDATDGTYSVPITFPPCSEEGCWTLAIVYLSDARGNSVSLYTADLTGAGFPVELCNGFKPGAPRAVIKTPHSGHKASGERVTVVAELVSGRPADTSQVRFEYRLQGGPWTTIPPANPNHPNPDVDHPYFVHWDVSALSPGTYELRAVAMDLLGAADPSPEVVTLVVDPTGPNLVERPDLLGRNQQRIEVAASAEASLLSADTSDERLHAVHLRAGSAQGDDWLAGTSLPPGEFTSPVFGGRHVVGGVELRFDSGQTTLDGGNEGDVLLTYLDQDDDGIVDGTTVPEGKLAIYEYHRAADHLEKLDDQARASTANVVRGRFHHAATFVLIEQLPFGTISGTVLDAATGSPVGGATVTTNMGGYASVTDASGLYTLDVEIGTYQVSVQAAGYRSSARAVVVVTQASVSVGDFALTQGSLTSVSPATGSTSGGTPITLSGTGFAPDSTVFFGGRPATSIQVQSSTTVTAVTPPGTTAGLVDVEVTTPDGELVRLIQAFEYVAPAPPAPSPPPSNSPPPSTSSPRPTKPRTSTAPVAAPGSGGGGGCQLGTSGPASSPWALLGALILVASARRRARCSSSP